jgi:YesN/AraC family two-component response regulator
MNILIVEDDRFMRGMLFQMIGTMGKHEVSCITNGHNAACLLADPAHGYDLVLIDLRMPRLTGDKVIELIKDIAQVHFIVLSGHPEEFPHLPKHIKVVKKPVDYTTVEKLLHDVEKKSRSSVRPRVAVH